MELHRAAGQLPLVAAPPRLADPAHDPDRAPGVSPRALGWSAGLGRDEPPPGVRVRVLTRRNI